jgi:hypothetical protein
MVMKVIPVILWVLAWQVPLPIDGVVAQSHAGPITANASMDGSPAGQPGSPMAADDYRTNIQNGVTADAYNLLPLAEHDAARTQSMIDGIAGRNPTRRTSAADADSADVGRASLLPTTATAVLWLAGLCAVVLMALRLRR